MPAIVHPGSLMNAMQFRGVGFSPLSISNLSFWLSSTNASKFTISDPASTVGYYRVIDQWSDSSPNARNFFTTGGNRPAYEGCWASRQDQPFLKLDTNQPSLGTSNFSFSIRCSVRVISSTRPVFSCRSSTGADVGSFLYFTSSGNSVLAILQSRFNGTSVQSQVSGLRLGDFYTIHCTIDRTGSQTIYVDGIGSASTSIAAYSAVSFTHSEEWYIGKDQRTTTFFQGFIREVAFYTGKLLNTSERGIINLYFVNSYPGLSPSFFGSRLFHHYDFSNAATITQSGGIISAITDAGTQNRTLSQSVVARRPTVVTASKNGLNTATFAGDTKTGLVWPGDFSTAPTLPPGSAVILTVMKSNISNSGSDRQVFGIGTDLSSVMRGISISNIANNATTLTMYKDIFDNIRRPMLTDEVVTSSGDWGVVAGVATQFNSAGSPIFITNSFVKFENMVGTAPKVYFGAAATDGDGVLDALNTPSTEYTLGIGFRGHSGSARVAYNSEIGECIILSGQVYYDEINRLIDYLRTKWGFT